MANISPEREALAGLVASAHSLGLADGKKFDPTKVTTFLEVAESDFELAGPEDATPIFLQRTTYMPTSVGHKALAVFGLEGPAKSRDNSEDVIHRSVEHGILARRPKEYEARDMPENINPRLAWIFELVIPSPDEHTVVMGGLQSQPFARQVV